MNWNLAVGEDHWIYFTFWKADVYFRLWNKKKIKFFLFTINANTTRDSTNIANNNQNNNITYHRYPEIYSHNASE